MLCMDDATFCNVGGMCVFEPLTREDVARDLARNEGRWWAAFQRTRVFKLDAVRLEARFGPVVEFEDRKVKEQNEENKERKNALEPPSAESSLEVLEQGLESPKMQVIKAQEAQQVASLVKDERRPSGASLAGGGTGDASVGVRREIGTEAMLSPESPGRRGTLV